LREKFESASGAHSKNCCNCNDTNASKLGWLTGCTPLRFAQGRGSIAFLKALKVTMYANLIAKAIRLVWYNHTKIKEVPARDFFYFGVGG